MNLIKELRCLNIQSKSEMAFNNKNDTEEQIDWLSWGLTTRQPLWVILCRLPEKGRK